MLNTLFTTWLIILLLVCVKSHKSSVVNSFISVLSKENVIFVFLSEVWMGLYFFEFWIGLIRIFEWHIFLKKISEYKWHLICFYK